MALHRRRVHNAHYTSPRRANLCGIPPTAPTMLYKFKSKIASDVLMLEPHGRHILQLWGVGDEAGLRKGILQPVQMPAAIAALEAAVAADDAQRAQDAQQAQERGEDTPMPAPGVSLRQRAQPMLDMVRRSLAADTPITWGV